MEDLTCGKELVISGSFRTFALVVSGQLANAARI
jgi:hypothetical protein